MSGYEEKITYSGATEKDCNRPQIEHSVLANELIPKFNKARREQVHFVTATDLHGIAKAKSELEMFFSKT